MRLLRLARWLALTLFVAGEAAKSKDHVATAGWLSAAGCSAFLAHVGCAFHFYHDWSHAIARATTARQTAELFGMNWGGGLYFNYAFGLLFIIEAVWQMARPHSFLRRPWWMTWSVRAFFLFMMFNGAVVFVRGASRWFGLILCLILMLCWWSAPNILPGRSRAE